MGEFFPVWDMCHDAYKRKVDLSPKDAEAKARGLPAKLSTPLTYTQIQTAIAFCFLLLKQRDLFFEFKGREGSDPLLAECSETLVDRDLQYSEGDKVISEFLRNIFRFGIGIITENWHEEKVFVPVDQIQPAPQVMGIPTGPGAAFTTWEPAIKFQGNKVRNISPYKFMPDPSVHLTKWKEGAFVAVESEYSFAELRKLEATKKCSGIGWISTYKDDDWTSMGRSRTARFLSVKPGQQNPESCIITEYYRVMVPKKTFAEGTENETLGTEEVPIMYLIWVANDQRVVRCEPVNACHSDWPISVGFFSPDEHDQEVSSMATIGEDLQKVHSWLINSRIGAVTRTMDGQVIASPLMVNMASIEQRQRIIQITKSGAQRKIDDFFKTLPFEDTTQGHFQDMAIMKEAIQGVTGVNDNMMGITSPGRRAATEMRNVMGGASSRMKLVVQVIWTGAFVPLANRMRTNHRQAISPEQFIAVCGQAKHDQYFEIFRANPVALASEYDFMTMDGTLPSEKALSAQSLQEILVMLMTNPSAPLQFGLSPRRLFYKICQLRGLGDMADVALTEQEATLMLTQMQTQMAMEKAAEPEPKSPNAK